MTPQHWTHAMEKQVCDRLNIVMTDPQLLAVYQKFGGAVFRRSSVFHGLAKFLETNNVRGKSCFEIGTWNGLTAIILSRLFKRVVTVDVAHNKLKQEILDFLGITNVRCIDIESNADKPKVLNGIEFDCAYLDGNHHDDTEVDFSITRKCGRVIFHECWPWQSPVWETVHALPSQQVVYGGHGLALWDSSRQAEKSK